MGNTIVGNGDVDDGAVAVAVAVRYLNGVRVYGLKVDVKITQRPACCTEADVSDMEFFIEQVKLILPVLGLDFLRAKPAPKGQARSAAATDTAEKETDYFGLVGKRDGIEARAYESDGEFIVLAGAKVRGRWASKSVHDSGYKRKLESLIDRGAIAEKDGRWITTEDLVFTSPSAASAIAFGRSSNGRISWIHETSGQTYADFQLATLDEA